MMILYTIDEIISTTNIECYGLAFNHEFNCTNKWDWYQLGVLNEGASSTLYWGDNIGYPSIKCMGAPLPTAIKWSWSIFGSYNHICCEGKKIDTGSGLSCCNDKIYNSHTHDCCGNIIYKKSINASRCGDIVYDTRTDACSLQSQVFNS
jgi:hypothetical protein